jgi:hypothetical protein
MMKAFQRAILLPRPEYGTRLCKFTLSLVWKRITDIVINNLNSIKENKREEK